MVVSQICRYEIRSRRVIPIAVHIHDAENPGSTQYVAWSCNIFCPLTTIPDGRITAFETLTKLEREALCVDKRTVRIASPAFRQETSFMRARTGSFQDLPFYRSDLGMLQCSVELAHGVLGKDERGPKRSHPSVSDLV